MNKNKRVVPWLLLAALLPGCQANVSPRGQAPSASGPLLSTKAVKLDDMADLQSILPALAENRVVFVGEVHTRFDNHLNQLAIIRGLYRRHPDLAIGVEYFQQPFQKYLDQYIDGRIDTTELLLKSQYYRRWGYDFRLYEPIFQFARQHRIPVIALNLPAEVIQEVGRVGLTSLPPQVRASLPADIDRSDQQYRRRLQRIYQMHPHDGKNQDFEKFYDVQLTWDEGMAARAAAYLKQHPQRPMVVLAGQGHLAYRSGIPNRLTRREPVDTAVVLNDWDGDYSPKVADFLLFSSRQTLPPAGTLGVLLTDAKPGAKVEAFADDSAAKAAGIEKSDELLALNGHPVSSVSDVKARLWDKKPGQDVTVKVRRGQDQRVYKVTLR